MWSCCTTSRKKTFVFENGTLVTAMDPSKAIELLKSISLKRVAEVGESGGRWVVNFHKNVFMEIQAPDPEQARRAAEWRVYLDRRAPRVREPA